MIVIVSPGLLFTIIFSLSCYTIYCENQNVFSHFSQRASYAFSEDVVPNPVERPLLIGSFNIQTFGKKKFADPDAIYIIEKIVERYDLILIMELMTSDSQLLKKFLRELNMFTPEGVTYNMTVSDMHPATNEHCAFLYRTNKVDVIHTESYYDKTKFYRAPYVVIFEAFTLNDMKRFGAIGHHVKPDQAVREIDALADLYDYVKQKYKTEDVLLMGDFNADCTYVKEQDWANISLWMRPEFTWAITSNMDTTTNYKSCALDRFVYAGENMNNGVILTSARAFNFQLEFELSVDETRRISDHWPIELQIRGKVSDIAAKYLTSEICFKIKDIRESTNMKNQEIANEASKAYFRVNYFQGGMILLNRTREKEEMLAAVKRLRIALPSIMTYEMEESIKYKVSHGSLKDDSSFADIWNPGYKINVLSTNEYSEALVCRVSSIN